jgi:hypothetical protein
MARQMESYPLCQLFSQSGARSRAGRHYSPLARALGQLPGRRTDAWAGQSVPRFLYCRLHRRSIWTRHILMLPVAVAGSVTTTSPRRLTAIPVPYSPSRLARRPSCAVSCPFQDPQAGSLVTASSRRHPFCPLLHIIVKTLS